ncbi:MAG: hypothetical protein H7232_11120 [Aeromicrobium sp.]|nr:hypothetical protein [Burkholderiales bacterium]
MTLRDELDEAAARAIHDGRLAPHERHAVQWEELSDRQRDCCGFDAKSAIDATLSFLAARGLKVVGQFATSDMEIDAKGDWPLANIYGELDQEECKNSSTDIFAAMWFAAPNLFAETDDAG